MCYNQNMTVKIICGKKRLHSIKVLALVLGLACSSLARMTRVAADELVTLNLGVTEVLSVSLDPVTTYVSGNVDDFLRNRVDLTIASNNTNGFVAYMTTKTDATALSNTTASATIPTLAANTSWTRSSNVTNFWGYSLDDTSETGTYYPMVGVSSTPIQIASQNAASNTVQAKTIHFGAKADVTKGSGVYRNTVVFTVVSGINTVPSGNTPQSNDPGNEPASSGSGNELIISGRDGGGGLIGKTDLGNGDGDGTRGVTYTPPQGVSSSSDIHDGDPVTTGLIATASVAAGAGVLFLILAKRDDDDEDEEGAEAA